MAKESKKNQPDADGYISTGIYRKYVGPKENLTQDEFREGLESFSRFTERLILLRSQIGDFIRPHVTLVETDNPREYPAGVTVHAIDLGDGSKAYTLSPDAEPVVMDGIIALLEIRRLLPAIERGDAVHSAKFAYLLGRLHEQMSVRGFEHAAKVGTERIEHPKNTMHKARSEQARRERQEKHERAVQALSDTKYRFPYLQDQPTLVRQKAADSIGVPESTLRRWLEYTV